jgi:hypothetical protein
MIFTDHKNKSFNGLKAFSSDRVLRLLLLIEEYGVKFEYLPGKIQENVGTVAPHNSIQHIEEYDILCCKERIYIPHSLRKMQRVLSLHHEHLLHPGQTRA